jgi:SWI/SNF-related matrix-associated actin-dependent regulator 1 of chromatin subfamily A
MGQKRDVHVIKLITKDTLEEDMLALADTKLRLDSEVSSSTQYPSGAGGTAAGGLAEVAESGDMAGAEKRMKSSLLSNLKKKVSEGWVCGEV